MKVLHLETGRHLYGGARQVAYLIEGLKAHGVTSLLGAPAESRILETSSEHCAAIIPLQTEKGTGFGLYREVRAAIRQYHPDLLHVHSRRLAVDFWGALAARREKIPAVLSRRVDNPEPGWLARLKYALFDHVITISEGIRRVLLREGVAPEHVTTVRSAIDIEEFTTHCDRTAFLETFKQPDDALTIGVIAQLIPRKGHRHLLSILPELHREFPDLRVLIFGQGPLQVSLTQAIEDAGLNDIVKLAGFRTDLPRWLPCLDLVVHPADMEGLGVSLIQAAASGVPIVASRAGGMPEVVHHEENGLLIEPGNTVELKAALERLLADPSLRKRMGQASRALAESSFSNSVMVAGNLAIYQRVLAARS